MLLLAAVYVVGAAALTGTLVVVGYAAQFVADRTGPRRKGGE